MHFYAPFIVINCAHFENNTFARLSVEIKKGFIFTASSFNKLFCKVIKLFVIKVILQYGSKFY